MLLDDFVSVLEVLEVKCDRKTFPAFVLDRGYGVVCVLLLLGKMDDGYIGSLSGKQDGHGTSYTGTT